MTKYFYSFIDRFKVILAIASLVLCGELISGGAVSFYFQIQFSNANSDADDRVNNVVAKYEGYLTSQEKKYEKQLNDKQGELDRSRDQVTRLTEVIERRIPLIVAQQDQNTDQLGQLAATVDSVATKTRQAATTASRAAGQASTAVKQARSAQSKTAQGSLRQVSNKPTPKKCWNNRDVYGDPCP